MGGLNSYQNNKKKCMNEMQEEIQAEGPLQAAFQKVFAEIDPNGRPAHEPGAKLDSGKCLAGVLHDFSLALESVALVGTMGAKKYTRGGWQSVPNGEERYFDAAWRHLLKSRHETLDPDSSLPHLAHLAWNILAVLELQGRSKL